MQKEPDMGSYQDADYGRPLPYLVNSFKEEFIITPMILLCRMRSLFNLIQYFTFSVLSPEVNFVVFTLFVATT